MVRLEEQGSEHNLKIGIWYSRTLYVSCGTITLMILWKDLQKRCKLRSNSNKHSPTSTTKYQHWMDIWSFTALIMFALSPVCAISKTIPVICDYTLHITTPHFNIQYLSDNTLSIDSSTIYIICTTSAFQKNWIS